MAADLVLKVRADTKQAAADIKGFNKDIVTSTNAASTSLTKLNKSVGGTTTTLTNFGRVVQDAPFGIIGIANNIDPLISSFQALKRETGSTGGALKALGAGLLGPAGIAIGISAVTSLLIAFGPQIKAFFSGTKEASLSAEAAAKAIKELDEAAAGFATTSQKLAGEELSGLNALIKGVNNINLSQQQRLFYVDELQKKYPAYFGNLSKEEILAGNTGDAYRRLTNDILAASKARAAQDVLSKISSQKLAIQEKQVNANAQALRDLAKATATIKITPGAGIGGTGSVQVSKEQNQEKIRRNLAETTRELNIETEKLNSQESFYVQFVDAGAAATANLGQEVEKTKEKTGKLASEQDVINFLWDKAIGKQVELKTGYEGLAGAAGIFRAELEKIREEQIKLATSKTATVARQFFTPDTPNIQGRGIAQSIKDAGAAFDKFTEENLSNFNAKVALASQELTNLFSGAFQALSEGQNPIKAITQSLKQLIVRLAAAAATAAILSVILNSITGGAGAAGAAAGGANSFKSIFGGLFGLKLASGGITTGPTRALIGEGGPEAVIPLSQLGRLIGGRSSGDVSVTGRLSGDNIYLSNQRGGHSFARLYG